MICSGECLFTTKEIFELLRLGGADYINPDLMRCGGVTEYIQICALAGAFRVPVTAHVLMEVSAHVLAASPTGGLLEHIPDWWNGAFAQAPVVEKGWLKLLDVPGRRYFYGKTNHSCRSPGREKAVRGLGPSGLQPQR